MKFQLLHELKESSLIRTETHYSRYTMRDILDYTFLYLIVFEIMRHDSDQKEFVRNYVKDSLRYGIDFKKYKKSGTDFYNFMHILFDDASHENLKDIGGAHKIAKDMSPQKNEFLFYLNAIRYDREIPESIYDRWMLKLEHQLLVKNSSYKAMRRMVRNWHTVDKDDRNRILRRLGSIFRQELRLSDLSHMVNKITVDNLKEDTQSGLNWAIGKDLQHAKGITMNDIMSGNNAVVWIDIEKAMNQVEKGWELDLKDPTGGIDRIGNRIDMAKDFFKKGNYMDPSFLGVSEHSGKIVFTDGRHRLVAAYQLGARIAPVIVPKDNLAALRALGVVTSSGIQEAEHNLIIEDLAKEYIAEYKYADIGIKSLGIPRSEMPQIKKGMQDEFLKYLHSEGIMYEYRSKPADLLKATQDEFDPDKVQKKTKQTKGKSNRPLIVSMDNYIIDGHHRWTSIIQRNPKKHVKILQVYIPIKQLLKLMHDFDGVSYEELKEDDLDEIRRSSAMTGDYPINPNTNWFVKDDLIELSCGYYLEIPTKSDRFLIWSDEGKVVGLIMAPREGNRLHVKVIRMRKDHKRMGCMSAAFLELLNQGFEILSDSGQTKLAEKMWVDLIRKVNMFLVSKDEEKQIFTVEDMKLVYRRNTVWDRLLMKKKSTKSFNESVSDIVYHFTNLHDLADILKTDSFRMTPNLGTSSDIIGNKTYFMSTSRSIIGDYNPAVHGADYGTVIKLDGRKLNQRFKGFPINYYGGSDFGRARGKSEIEDRIVSDKPYIKDFTSYITEIHILIDETIQPNSPHRGPKKPFTIHNSLIIKSREIFKLAKKFNIPLFYYEHKKDFKVLNKKNTKSFIQLGIQPEERSPHGYAPVNRKPLKIWFELLLTDDYDKLSSDAKRRLDYGHDIPRILSADFHNNKTSEMYRPTVDRLIALMKKNEINSVNEYAKFVLRKFDRLNEMGGVGKIVKGVNTTVDVGPDETKKQAKKFGFKLNKNNEPPLLEYVDPEKTVSKNFVALYTKLKSDQSAKSDFPFIKDWPQINPLELTTPREPEFQAQREQMINSMSRDMAAIIKVIINRVDPTPNHNYSLWLVQRYIKGGITYWEDMYKATLYLKTFDIMKKKRIFKEKYSADINQYKTLNQLAQIHKEFGEVAVTKRGEEEELINNGEVEILLNTARIKVVVPKTSKASCYYGQNTEWCTTAKFGRNYFDEYNRKGPLYIILDKKNNRRFQLHFETQQYMDENDNPIGIDAEEASITTRSQLPISLFKAYPEIVDVLPVNREEGNTWHAKTSKLDYWTDDDGLYHRDIGPAKIIKAVGLNPKVRVYSSEWYQHGKIHRDNGPARITLQSVNGELKSTTEEWYQDDQLHRLDGPAIITPNEKEWFRKGIKHRDNGPALVRKDGYNKWYSNGKVHRIDGPAIVDVYNGNIGDGLLWVINGERHREGGPAMINVRESGIIEMWLENDAMKQFGDDSGANYPQEALERPNVIRLVNLDMQGDKEYTEDKGYVMEWLRDNDPETGEIYNTWHSALVERSIGDNGKIYTWANSEFVDLAGSPLPNWPPLSQDEIAELFAKYNSPTMRKAEEEKWTSLENGYEDF